MLAVIATFCTYVLTFWIIRVGAGANECGVSVIFFPTGAVRTFYRPLIVADKFLNFPVLYDGESDESVYDVIERQCE